MDNGPAAAGPSSTALLFFVLLEHRSCCFAARFDRPLAPTPRPCTTELQSPPNSPPPPLQLALAPATTTAGCARVPARRRTQPRPKLCPVARTRRVSAASLVAAGPTPAMMTWHHH